MLVVCAWCKQEGQPAILGEEGGDGPPTHGICERHELQLLERLPSRSFPGVETVYIVPADKPELYWQLSTTVGALPTVKVIIDRRRSERRAEAADDAKSADRRVGDRRRRHAEVHPLGYLIVRFQPRP